MYTNREDVEKILKKAQTARIKASEYIFAEIDNRTHYSRITESLTKGLETKCILQASGPVWPSPNLMTTKVSDHFVERFRKKECDGNVSKYLQTHQNSQAHRN